MAIKVGSTTIPTTLGSIKVGSTNVTKVNVVSGGTTTTVWEAVTQTYIIQNGSGLSSPTKYIKQIGSIGLSSDYSATASNNGGKVVYNNKDQTHQVGVYFKYPNAITCKGQKLYINATVNITTILSSKLASSSGILLCVFDSSGNIVQESYVANVHYYANGETNVPLTISGGNITLPSSGTYYIGFGIHMWGSYSNEFTLNISSMYLQG